MGGRIAERRNFKRYIALIGWGLWMTACPGTVASAEREGKTMLRENLRRHVEHLTVRIGERNLWKEGTLEQAAAYIEQTLRQYGYPVERQTYPCYGKTASNLVAEKQGIGSRIVVGAHYDTVPGSPGADDNASAVAGLLELARLLRESPGTRPISFVAFANEEPPFYGSTNMGSMVYAASLKEKNLAVDFMISLEMIGFFTREEIQQYPLPVMGLFYPKTADFIGVVGNFRSWRCVSLLKKGIRRHSGIGVQTMVGPESVGGINLSDNYSFWRHGFKAVMVTDSAFFRNRHYHQETDTMDTLNFDSMAEVILGLFRTLGDM
ncbi:MAG: M20/M25/M40 family metallo-hydrolase [Thermodesulfobacteriota bacterium]